MSDSKRSFTSSSSRDEALRRTTKIVNSFLANEELTPFREPVDWRGLELMDYTQVVKKPMDLGTIKRRLDRLQYSCAAEVAHDIRLVWKNCMRYNAPGTDIWNLAKSYSKRFEDRYRRIRNEYDCGEEPIYSDEEEDEPLEREMEDESEDDEDDEDEGEEEEFEGNRSETSSHAESRSSNKRRSSTPTPPKLDARAKFANNLLLLNGVHLGHVIQMLEKQCPTALESGDELEIPGKMEIIIDKIEPAEIFHAVATYAAEKAVRTNRSVAVPKIEDVSNKRAKK